MSFVVSRMLTIVQTFYVFMVINDSANGFVCRSNVAMCTSVQRVASTQPNDVLAFTNRLKSRAVKTVGKLNAYQKVTFSWVKDLMSVGNARSLQIEDLLTVDGSRLQNVSDTFSTFFDAEKSRPAIRYAKNANILQNFWVSPVTRAVMKMYKKEFVYSGILKLLNTLVQFTPSIIISRLLKLADLPNSLVGAPLLSQQKVRLGLLCTATLFLSLCSKTVLENQYFDEVINLGANIRSALSSAIYKKSLNLTPTSRQNSTAGEIINFMQLDTARLEYVAGSIHTVWDGLLQVCGYTALLLHFLGPSVLVGILAMVFIIPLNAHFFDKLSQLKVELLRLTDSRVRLTSEVLQGVRAIKSLCWERPFAAMLTATRAAELDSLKRSANARALLIAILSAAPSIVAVLTLGVYALLGNVLTPTKVFTSLALFNQLRFPLIFFPMLLNTLAEGKVSLDRITSFLALPESQNYVQSDNSTTLAISVENCTFAWQSDANDGTISWNSNSSRLIQQETSEKDSDSSRGMLRHIDLRVRRGELVAVAGPVGCGKSSLLSALLGDMTLLRSGGSNGAGEAEGLVVVNGPVAYVSQTPWIPSDTLRGAVLFGRPLDPARYARVLQLCGLERDLELLEAGDLTEVGERGATLSGGQRQRLAVARALYEGEAAGAEVYLLDDPLSALDAEVGGRLFTRVIGPAGALRDKTRLLVTHQLSLLAQADRVVLMRQRPPGSRGAGECEVLDQGSLAELQARGYDLAALLKTPSVSKVSDKVSAVAEPVTYKSDAVDAEAETDAGDLFQRDEVDNILAHKSVLPVSATIADAILPGDVDECVTEECLAFARTLREGTAGCIDANAVVAASDQHGVHLHSEQGSHASSSTGSSCTHTHGSHDSGGGSNSGIIRDSGISGSISSSSTSDVSPRLSSIAGGHAVSQMHISSLKQTSASAPLSAAAAAPPGRRTMTVEDKGEGAVPVRVYAAYLQAARSPLLLAVIGVAFLLSTGSQVLQQWAVGAWTSDVGYVRLPLGWYLAGVGGAAAGVAFFTWLRAYLGTLFFADSSLALHNNMVQRVLAAPLSYFESTPVGRLVQRFSRDMDQMDQQLPGSLAQLAASALGIAGALVTVSLATPSFAVAMVPVLALYLKVTGRYRTVARELKRADSVSRSPVYQQFGETLAGLQVIRAFRKQRLFQRMNEVVLDDNFAAYFSLKAVDRWLSVRLEFIGNLIVLLSSLLAVVAGSKGGLAGISLSNAMSVTTMLNWAVRNGAETESYMNSVERILYTTENTPSERVPLLGDASGAGYNKVVVDSSSNIDRAKITASPSQSNSSPASVPNTVTMTEEQLLSSGWPWRGGIEFRDVHMRYRPDSSPVLRGVTLQVRPGESVGIVGRTGSGKSSLFRVLLRLTEAESGSIFVDGVDIASLSLEGLRSRISIIPQDAVLFSGTIRMNLDPFGTSSDQELWRALEQAHALRTVSGLPGGLSFAVGEGGENFSAGQRQLICLARALLRKSKIVILDEATSSVDLETDQLVQRTLREQFGGGQSTVLTIAHRLETIMDADRVLVMEAGAVGEIGAPQDLLRNSSSLFSQLVAADTRNKQRSSPSNSNKTNVV